MFGSALFTIRVDVPALDRLVNFLQTSQQAQIDAITAQLGQQTQRLNQSSTALKGVVPTNL